MKEVKDKHEQNYSKALKEFRERSTVIAQYVKSKAQEKPKKLNPRYSGRKSDRFWKIVNSLNDTDNEVMYALGVALQDLEYYVLRCLEKCNESEG